MLTERILLILGATAVTVGVFAFVPGPPWARLLVGGIIVAADILIILSLRRPRAPGQHPHSVDR